MKAPIEIKPTQQTQSKPYIQTIPADSLIDSSYNKINNKNKQNSVYLHKINNYGKLRSQKLLN